MTPRERVLKALRFEKVDRVPFTMYAGMAPQCAAERVMRNRGLCLVRGVDVFRTLRPDVKESHRYYEKDGKRLLDIVFETPVGRLSMLKEPAGFTTWIHERMFKSPDDYKAIRFMIENECYEPCYGDYVSAERDLGGDFVLRSHLGAEPMQVLVSGDFLSMESFCIEWMENRDELVSLADLIMRKRREALPLVAGSPATLIMLGGNVVPEVTGPPVFEQYYLPFYEEVAEALHPRGKLIGSHLDANCKLLAPLIAKSKLDCIEAFTPSPTTDMTLGEARKAWPDKILWLNFPSQVHLAPDAEVERATVGLLDEVPRAEGIIMGNTETIPEHRWQGSCSAIMDGLDRHARENPKLYL